MALTYDQRLLLRMLVDIRVRAETFMGGGRRKAPDMDTALSSAIPDYDSPRVGLDPGWMPFCREPHFAMPALDAGEETGRLVDRLMEMMYQ